MIVYKLTDKDGRSHGDTQWGENVTHEGTGKGELCGPGYIHWYSDPLLAVMLNPIHGAFDPETMRLWRADNHDSKTLTDHGLKGGSVKLTTLHEIPVPTVTTEQRVKFAILCTLAALDARK
jgi:hypothetical protein